MLVRAYFGLVCDFWVRNRPLWIYGYGKFASWLLKSWVLGRLDCVLDLILGDFLGFWLGTGDYVFRDYQAHDLGCTLAEGVQSSVAPMSVNIELVSISVASMYLDGVVADFQRVLAGKHFGLSRLGFEGLALAL